jgi:hypothetical protein
LLRKTWEAIERKEKKEKRREEKRKEKKRNGIGKGRRAPRQLITDRLAKSPCQSGWWIWRCRKPGTIACANTLLHNICKSYNRGSRVSAVCKSSCVRRKLNLTEHLRFDFVTGGSRAATMAEKDGENGKYPKSMTLRDDP